MTFGRHVDTDLRNGETRRAPRERLSESVKLRLRRERGAFQDYQSAASVIGVTIDGAGHYYSLLSRNSGRARYQP